ncbi:MAG TPA: hypothetical protein VGE30_02195 [Candidatus Saccharimonadales bacterium]
MKGGEAMSQLLQAVLENPEARGPAAISVAANQAAEDFAPWGAIAE